MLHLPTFTIFALFLIQRAFFLQIAWNEMLRQRNKIRETAGQRAARDFQLIGSPVRLVPVVDLPENNAQIDEQTCHYLEKVFTYELVL